MPHKISFNYFLFENTPRNNSVNIFLYTSSFIASVHSAYKNDRSSVNGNTFMFTFTAQVSIKTVVCVPHVACTVSGIGYEFKSAMASSASHHLADLIGSHGVSQNSREPEPTIPESSGIRLTPLRHSTPGSINNLCQQITSQFSIHHDDIKHGLWTFFMVWSR
jgi:hypothetical protein